MYLFYFLSFMSIFVALYELSVADNIRQSFQNIDGRFKVHHIIL